MTKTLKNKGKYIAYERESCISGWHVIFKSIKALEDTRFAGFSRAFLYRRKLTAFITQQKVI